MLPDDHELERLYAYPQMDRPWVRTNFVTTIDGAAYAVDGRSGSLGGADDTRVFALLRSLTDVIVVGAGTARAERYGPVKAGDIDSGLRARLGLATSPPIAIVSRRLDIPEALVSPGQLVITTSTASQSAIDRLRETIDVIAIGEERIDWPAVLAEFADRGWTRVLCEGGPSLHGDLVALDLVDEICLTIAPVLSAGDAPRIAHGDTPVEHAMVLGHALDADGVLLTRWVRDRTYTPAHV
ncbi:pyrimidine reductase family protein [Aeromicrobium sp.]|uniref:pyrimidine reductase family protein n=1 Tax=Aeromicrobium sp. TaxID=1871063 RepID=UPI0019ADF44F|nr:pyrimidine reductase family protein [Aeromicrobium sp.]MBC7630027.1 pyrimidine reductase family protein [Aeromicrobium sp.]